MDGNTLSKSTIMGLAEGRFSGRTANPAETTQAAGRPPKRWAGSTPSVSRGRVGSDGDDHDAAVSFDPCSSVPSATLVGRELYRALGNANNKILVAMKWV